jgi:hypothetical protein
MLPNVRGLITTQDGASILFEFRGRTIFEGNEPGQQNLVGWFESDHESYRWLNDLVCIAREGSRATGPDMVINVYAGIHEMSARSTTTFSAPALSSPSTDCFRSLLIPPPASSRLPSYGWRRSDGSGECDQGSDTAWSSFPGWWRSSTVSPPSSRWARSRRDAAIRRGGCAGAARSLIVCVRG